MQKSSSQNQRVKSNSPDNTHPLAIARFNRGLLQPPDVFLIAARTRMYWAKGLNDVKKQVAPFSNHQNRRPHRTLAACSTPARLRLVAAANVRLTVCAAVRRALGLVFLRQLLLAHLVAVIGCFASLRSLFVARVLLGFHMGFLHSLVQVQGAWPSPVGPISL